MIQFLLNDKLITTGQPPGMIMVDFIRYHQHLTGTKIGCREGDCGACTILTGELREGRLEYNSVTCCLMPLANAQGKHVVTIEGTNITNLNAIQQFMCDESATQCGFCTPGFVMSLVGFCLKGNPSMQQKSTQNAVAAVDGNICRCTGYKSIERAAHRVAALVQENEDDDTTTFLINKSVLPNYFSGIKNRLELIRYQTQPNGEGAAKTNEVLNQLLNRPIYLGGGTDLYVQQPEALVHGTNNFMFNRSGLKGITREGNKCVIGAAETVAGMLDSPVIQEFFPGILKFSKLISSTPIRNMATLAGNFINASPIGDLSIFFLALDARLILSDDISTRELPLQDLYQGYKLLAKQPSEYIRQVWFSLPDENTLFNFEKVSKRTHLDIASVNTALSITVEDRIITKARLSAGGVGPIPLYLSRTSAFLQDKELSATTVRHAIQEALSEISPISDIRGTATYKRLLLKQLIKAHFITLFPYLENAELIFI